MTRPVEGGPARPVHITGLDVAVGGGGGGDASAANQATGNASLATIATQTNLSKGTGVMDATTLRVVQASDGPSVSALGGVADAAYTSGSGSIISILKGVFASLANIVLMAFDSTSRLRVSTYGKGAGVAGDTAALFSTAGRQQVTAGSSSSLSDGATNIGGWLAQNDATIIGQIGPSLYNGSGWDRQRNNIDATILASAARTATTNSADQTNYNGRSLRVDIDITAVSGAASLVFNLQLKDALSGVYVTVLSSAALTATGHVQLQYGAGAATVANLSAPGVIGRLWRVTVTHATADTVTYSVGASVSN